MANLGPQTTNALYIVEINNQSKLKGTKYEPANKISK